MGRQQTSKNTEVANQLQVLISKRLHSFAEFHSSKSLDNAMEASLIYFWKAISSVFTVHDVYVVHISPAKPKHILVPGWSGYILPVDLLDLHLHWSIAPYARHIVLSEEVQ